MVGRENVRWNKKKQKFEPKPRTSSSKCATTKMHKQSNNKRTYKKRVKNKTSTHLDIFWRTVGEGCVGVVEAEKANMHFESDRGGRARVRMSEKKWR